ncbi:rhamnulokinase family protein [Schumannella luteola]|uniref:Rhamnulokinase n=1 Tax=Schumannella luteola TaxID=472059 RepID=A0A852YD16_9MICO|nr:rhamnulokinase family protein [Schumannella luteola]NYG97517.1 rhamnulokinase [Schumannella luteola]TPX01538.1 rhamnulokinase [Schumannella luteola]
MSGRSGAVAAVDLGATSGRVVVGRVDGAGSSARVHLDEVARFENRPVRTLDGLHWSVLELYRDAVEGLAAAARVAPDLAGIGIDSWAVDYALLRGGRMLSTPYAYRDERTAAAVPRVHARVAADELYARNGLQHLDFTTLFQLDADREAGVLDLADRLLLLPDLLAHWLTGAEVAERTNASTTGLLGVGRGGADGAGGVGEVAGSTAADWDRDLAVRLGIPPRILPPLVDAGTELGALTATAARGVGDTRARVIAVGSHDTASAIVSVPATEPGFAYISSGTWSLVGVETERPVVTEEARRAGFTNEGGVDGRTRFLHNVMGLWLLTESLREWEREDGGARPDLGALLAAAAEVPAGAVAEFDADDPAFTAPGDMPVRIAAWLTAHDRPVPATRPELVRSILASLATASARAVHEAARLSGQPVRVVHIVGGGSRNALLCQLTADATGLPVVAGPAEATALGNVLVQARALGLVHGDLEALRALVIASSELTTYRPRTTH